MTIMLELIKSKVVNAVTCQSWQMMFIMLEMIRRASGSGNLVSECRLIIF